MGDVGTCFDPRKSLKIRILEVAENELHETKSLDFWNFMAKSVNLEVHFKFPDFSCLSMPFHVRQWTPC